MPLQRLFVATSTDQHPLGHLVGPIAPASLRLQDRVTLLAPGLRRLARLGLDGKVAQSRASPQMPADQTVSCLPVLFTVDFGTRGW
ncbi:MAG TPA: hypothetical protein VFR80_05540 [Pyrinomonadaceae bacterium]|nr:hypothetical protein [Pyrinomonadaceae bacterium]